MQAQKEAPKDNMQCKDKFLIQSAIANSRDISANMFNKEEGRNVQERKLRVVLIAVGMSNGGLLQIEPQELQFPFELRRQISCSMQLINKGDNYVAFKVKTTNPKKYCVRPNTGIVLPHSTCDVIVTMQRQNEAPQDNMQCKDKFLVQSVISNSGATTSKDFIENMFKKEEGGLNVKECKLSVAYYVATIPQPPSPVRKVFEEGSSSRGSHRFLRRRYAYQRQKEI